MSRKLAELAASLGLFLFVSLSVEAAERQVLRGHVPAAVALLNLLSQERLPSTTRIDLLIGLALRNPGEVTNLLAQLYDPSSPQYHHWLTPEQIAQKFGPSERDYQALIAHAQTSGLQVTGTHADRTFLRVSGAAGDLEKMLQVRIQVYRHPKEARTFYAPDVEPSLDLAVPLSHISGLDSFNLPRPGGGRKEIPSGAAPGDGAGSGPSGGFWGYDLRKAYVPGVNRNGAGQVVGLLELDGYYANDITAYEVNSGLPNVPLTNVLVDGFSGAPSTNANSVGEVSLDIDMAIAMAPGLSRIMVYEATNSGSNNWLDILKRMQEDNVAKQLSSSWFVYDDANADTVYQQFAMQGQSFFQCSGDDLAFYNGNGQWADDPNITVVGGTLLTTSGEAWVSETTWTNAGGINGSGGGISASYMGNVAIPSWQRGVSMSLNGGSTTQRNVPDVAMVAHNVYIYYMNGQHAWFWGTSIAAPLWAGFTALVNEQAVAHGQPTVGFLNPLIYAIGQGPNYASCFHDITLGNNTSSNSLTAYYATAGYDLCTGWGSPSGTNLINLLVQAGGGAWVDFNYSKLSPQSGTYPQPYSTLAQGTNAVSAGGTIFIKTAGASLETMTISKRLTLTATGGAATIGH